MGGGGVVVCAAVVGPANNPLYLKTLAPVDDEVKFHYMVHASLDAVEEKVRWWVAGWGAGAVLCAVCCAVVLPLACCAGWAGALALPSEGCFCAAPQAAHHPMCLKRRASLPRPPCALPLR